MCADGIQCDSVPPVEVSAPVTQIEPMTAVQGMIDATDRPTPEGTLHAALPHTTCGEMCLLL